MSTRLLVLRGQSGKNPTMRLTKLFPLAVLTATPAIFFASGCVENASSVFIYQVQYVKPGECEVTFGPDEAFVSSGVLDPAFQRGYEASLLIANQLTPLGNANALRSETSHFSIKGAEVYVSSADLGTELAAYTTVASGTVAPTTSAEPGYGGASVLVIPPGLELEPNSSYVATVRIYGETLAGAELETPEFQFPIFTVGYGAFAYGLTDNGCDEGATSDVDACNPGQGPTSCRFCAKPDCTR